MQPSVFHINDEHGGNMTRWVKCINAPLLCPYRINVDSMKMSDHVEFVAPQISDLAETMAKRMLVGIRLT